jgi:DNA-binding transcriptional LysR family regulator
MTPSGVSRAVARLEARLGVRLFARTPRSVALTEEGRRFHAQVLPLLTSIEEAATEAADASTAVSGRLRLSIDPWFSRMLMAPRLSRFLERHPRLSVEIGVSNHREELMTGVDVAVRFGPTEPSSLIARKLLETRIVTCAAGCRRTIHRAPSRRACRAMAYSRALSSASILGFRAVSSYRSSSIGVRSATRCMRTTRRVSCRRPRSGHSSISCWKSPRKPHRRRRAPARPVVRKQGEASNSRSRTMSQARRVGLTGRLTPHVYDAGIP